MNINDRLRLIRTKTNESQAKFALRFNLPQSTYAQYEKGGRAIPDELKNLLTKDLSINLNWLITGDGPMFLSGEPAPKIEKEIDETTALIPVTNLKLSAGGGIDWAEGSLSGEMLPMPRKIVNRYNSYNLFSATVKGDSMEPTLKNGEPVVFAKGVLEEDGIYVIAIFDELFVKRISVDKLDRKIMVISDNTKYPVKEYPMDKEGLQILGKVVFWLHME